MSKCADARKLALCACVNFAQLNASVTRNARVTRKRKRQTREAEDDDLAEAAALLRETEDGTAEARDSDDDGLDCWEELATRRRYEKKPRGKASMIHMLIEDPFWWNDIDFQKNLRVTHPTFVHIVELLEKDVTDSVNPISGAVVQKKEFKVAVFLYHLGHGGTWRTTANVAKIGVSTARKYVRKVAAAVVKCIKPIYMPGKPCADRLTRVTRKFTERRGLGNVAMTVDGCHVPWQPDEGSTREDYHNYKGWYSVLCLMFVDSFYMFVDGEVGHPGRQSDSAISEFSWLLGEIRENKEEWLGKDGMIIGDGGFAQDDFLMTPFANARTNRDHLFNFCFSSTRFYVEQAFGW